MRKRRRKPPRNYDLLDYAGERPSAAEALRAFLSPTEAEGYWRSEAIVPAGSAVDRLNEVFRAETSLPLELPFFVFLHFVAAHLLSRGSHISLFTQRIDPALWTVLLAPQGTLKTLTTDWISAGIRESGAEIPLFSGAPTGPKQFAEALAHNNRSLWVRDEFGQFLRHLDTQSYMAPMKDLMLKMTNGVTVEWGDVRVDRPGLVILGLTVTETFAPSLSPDALLDGFASRFGFVVTCERQDKGVAAHAHFQRGVLVDAVAKAWRKVVEVELHEAYTLAPKAFEAYEDTFRHLWTKNETQWNSTLPEGFFRRILFRAHNYGLIYHILRQQESAVIDEESMMWAARLCHMQMLDARKLLQQHGLNDVAHLLEKVRVYCQRNPSAREKDILTYVRGVKNAAHARELLSLVRN